MILLGFGTGVRSIVRKKRLTAKEMGKIWLIRNLASSTYIWSRSVAAFGAEWALRPNFQHL